MHPKDISSYPLHMKVEIKTHFWYVAFKTMLMDKEEKEMMMMTINQHNDRCKQ
jgi:hypothetical protein